MHMQKQYKHDSELYNFAFAEPHTPCVGMPTTLDYEVVELCKQSSVLAIKRRRYKWYK